MTHDRVKELLNYDPDTGVFHWRTARPGANQQSKVGTVKRGGYLLITIDREHVLAHRLAIFYMTGEWPQTPVDHIDGDPSNNRYANLRAVPQATNVHNQRKVRVSSKSGIMGVSYVARDDIWRARILINGVRKSFYNKSRTVVERMYLDAKRQHHEGFTL
jgi:hypothetical protein